MSKRVLIALVVIVLISILGMVLTRKRALQKGAAARDADGDRTGRLHVLHGRLPAFDGRRLQRLGRTESRDPRSPRAHHPALLRIVGRLELILRQRHRLLAQRAQLAVGEKREDREHADREDLDVANDPPDAESHRKLAALLASPVSSRMCMPVLARSTMSM